jgi:hypothetical protein
MSAVVQRDQPAREVVSVAPTQTELLAPYNVTHVRWLTVEVINDDVDQELDCTWQGSASSDGPWTALVDTTLAGISALESRCAPKSTIGLQWVRLVGTASGSGLDCRVAAWSGQ